MTRISIWLTIMGVLFCSAASAQAQTVTASGTVDWTALAHFDAHSAEVVFADITDVDNPLFTVVPLDRSRRQAGLLLGHAEGVHLVLRHRGRRQLRQRSGVVRHGRVAGTHIRFNNSVQVTPDSGSTTIVVTADSSGDPVGICGSVTVQ